MALHIVAGVPSAGQMSGHKLGLAGDTKPVELKAKPTGKLARS